MSLTREAVHDRTLYQTAEVHSKHGVILSCTFALPAYVDSEMKQQLLELGKGLKQQKYGFVDEDALGAVVRGSALVGDVWNWLRGTLGCVRTYN